MGPGWPLWSGVRAGPRSEGKAGPGRRRRRPLPCPRTPAGGGRAGAWEDEEAEDVGRPKELEAPGGRGFGEAKTTASLGPGNPRSRGRGEGGEAGRSGEAGGAGRTGRPWPADRKPEKQKGRGRRKSAGTAQRPGQRSGPGPGAPDFGGGGCLGDSPGSWSHCAAQVSSCLSPHPPTSPVPQPGRCRPACSRGSGCTPLRRWVRARFPVIARFRRERH